MSTIKGKVLFSVSSLGLGHATRTLPIIKNYISTHEVHLVSAGNALVFLKKELENSGVFFYDCLDYPPIERGEGLMFYYYIVVDSLCTLIRIHKENVFINNLAKKIEPVFIISDGRYGSYVKNIPSFIISHQISFIMPKGLSLFQKLADYVNYKTFKNFTAVLIPDYEDLNYCLAGKLSHNDMLKKLKHHYVGILSSLKKEDLTQDIEVLFSTGGFLSLHKSSFIDSLMEQAKSLPGRKVFILGKVSESNTGSFNNSDIRIISHVAGVERNNLYNSTKVVVTRSGYTTIMDLVEIEKFGIIIPTPGQTEQEYLAEYLHDKKYFITSEYPSVAKAHTEYKASIMFKPPWKTAETLKKIEEIIAINSIEE
ncbi:MAG: glycosyltransferase [bacterium]